MSLYALTVTVHVLAALLWVGGMMFLSAVAVPALRHVEPPQRAQIFRLVGRQFRWLGWASIGALLVTGVINLSYYVDGLDDLLSGAFWDTRFGTRLAIKIGLIGAMLVLSGLHDFVLGPRSVEVSSAGQPGPPPASRRRLATWLPRTNLLLGIIVVAVSVGLTR